MERRGKGFQRCIIQDVAGVKDAAGIELDPLRTTLRTDFGTGPVTAELPSFSELMVWAKVR
jgi:hypothetical protein